MLFNETLEGFLLELVDIGSNGQGSSQKAEGNVSKVAHDGGQQLEKEKEWVSKEAVVLWG